MDMKNNPGGKHPGRSVSSFGDSGPAVNIAAQGVGTGHNQVNVAIPHAGGYGSSGKASDSKAKGM